VHPVVHPQPAPERQTGGTQRVNDPTCQTHGRKRGAGRVDLAAGELAGGEVTSTCFLSERRTQRTSLGHRRCSRVSKAASMAGRWCGSPPIRRSRPWHGWIWSAQDPRGQGECDGTRNLRKKRKEWLHPREHELGGHGAAVPRRARSDLTLGKKGTNSCARDGGGPGGAVGRRYWQMALRWRS
jgi:hypothetical protein